MAIPPPGTVILTEAPRTTAQFQCTLLCADGSACQYIAKTRRGLTMHQVGPAHGHRNPVWDITPTNVCPFCFTAFSSRQVAFQHVTAALKNGCKPDKTRFKNKPVVPKSMQCSICQQQYSELNLFLKHLLTHFDLLPPSIVLSE